MNYTNKSDAIACVRGGAQTPNLQGSVQFYQKPEGVLVVANIRGLPPSPTGFFGFHIHQGTGCGGTDFSDTQGHYNPRETPHPQHPGDLPPLLAAGDSAYLAVKTDRFTLGEIIGRTVVIHSMPDDFTSQPAGNAGTKIACGVVKKE